MAALRTSYVGRIQTSTRPVSDSKYIKCHIQFECVLRVISLRSAKQFWIYFSLVLVCGKNAPSRTLVSATDEHYRFPFDFHRLDFSPLFTRCRLEMEAVSRNFVSRQVSLDHYIKIIICIKLFLYLYFVVFLFK